MARHTRARSTALTLGVTAILVVGAACGSDDSTGTGESPSDTAPTSVEASEPEPAPITEPAGAATVPTGPDFVPSVPLPVGVPVHPTAVMWSDFPAGTTHHYLYNSEATAEELVAFFEAAFTDAGLEVTATFAVHEEFGVQALPVDAADPFRHAIAVYFLDDGLGDGVTPSTPGRGYGLTIDAELWNTG